MFLADEELESLKSEFALLHQEVSTELVSEKNVIPVSDVQTPVVKPAVDLSSIEEKIDKFSLIFQEKDKMLEEKNKIIVMLQHRIGELETKIQSMIALPDYTKEKQEAIAEKQKLEERLEILKGKLKEQEMKTFVVIGCALVFMALAIFLYLKWSNA
ncbi:MAG: hypothetical protein K6E76_01530 [Patescibacteria group bacterium]|nr:hypothetical protein [Patescibacteria group bacterium]